MTDVLFEIVAAAIGFVVLFCVLGNAATDLYWWWRNEIKDRLKKQPDSNPAREIIGTILLGAVVLVVVPLIFIGGCSGRSPYLY